MIFTTDYKKNNPSLLAQIREANKYLPWINEAAGKYNLQPCVIAGLGSRESHWGLALQPEGPEGTGDGGHGRGLLQADDRWHEFARTGKWHDPRENILYGCGYLSQMRANFVTFGSIFRAEGLIRAMLASYNAGTGNALKALARCLDVDTYTSGHDYSADVLQRAGWFQLQGWT